MRFLKMIDFFGIELTFSTFQEKKYKTALGGIISMLSGTLILVAIFFFGQDFFYRLNPNILTQRSVPEDYEVMGVTNKNFSILWRVEDENSIPIKDEHKVLFPRLSYLKYRINKKTNSWELLANVKMRTKLCSETSNMDNHNLVKSVKQIELWNCIDWDGDKDLNENKDFNIGGSWSAPYVNYLVMSLETCDDSGKTNCSSLNSIKEETLKRRQYFSVMIPDYYFSANDIKEPLKTTYFTYYKTITPYLKKITRYYFTQTKILDDLGWIFESIEVKSAISLEKTDKSIDILFPDDYSVNPYHYLSQILVYHERSFDQYGRRYMKLQELAAVVGGFMKIIIVVFRFLMSYYNNMYRTINIIDAIMDTETFKSNQNLLINTNNPFEYKINKIPNEIVSQDEKKIKNTNINPSTLPIAHRKPNLNQPSNLLPFHRSSFQLQQKSEQLSNLNQGQVLNSIKASREKYRASFNFNAWKLLRSICCRKCDNRALNAQYNLFKNGKMILEEKLDVVTYLNALNSLSSMKSVLFNKQENLCFRRLAPINPICQASTYNTVLSENAGKIKKSRAEEEKEKNEVDHEIVLYFVNKLIDNEVTEKDRRLYSQIETRLQEEVMKQVKSAT